jgi:hypothetical protein
MVRAGPTLPIVLRIGYNMNLVVIGIRHSFAFYKENKKASIFVGL